MHTGLEYQTTASIWCIELVQTIFHFYYGAFFLTFRAYNYYKAMYFIRNIPMA